MATSQLRSTKGASKQRRDNINSEVSIIRSLLPLPDAVKNRLSQLQVMSMCKAFVGKCNMMSTMTNDKSELISQLWDFTQTLPGFLLVTDCTGHILYLTENILEYMGHSMVDIVGQCESVLDLVHPEDKGRFVEAMQTKETPCPPCTFSCRMGLMKHPRRSHAFDKYKRMKVSGRMVTSAEGGVQRYLVALCTPQLDHAMASDYPHLFDTLTFKSTHSLDMKLASLDGNGQFHLGYNDKQVHGMSWYGLIHPDDVAEAARKHTELLKSNFMDFSVSMTARFQRSDGRMVWVHVVMRKEVEEGREEGIVCCNQVMHPAEVACKVNRFATTRMDYRKEGLNFEVKDGRKMGGGGKMLKRECPPEVERQDDKKMDRSELIEKLKKKMKRNDGNVGGGLFDDNSGFWQVAAKEEANNIQNFNVQPTAHNSLDLSSQGFVTLSSFSTPLNQFSAGDQPPDQTYDQGYKREHQPCGFQMDPPKQQAIKKEQLSLASSVNSDLMLLQETLLRNSFNNIANNPSDHSHIINNISISNHSNYNNTTSNNVNSIQTYNNAGFNNTTTKTTSHLPSYLDSTSHSTPSYAAFSPYSASSPPNSEDLNNQSFFGQLDEIKSEFPYADNKVDFMFDDLCKVKSHLQLAPRSSFPELEAQDVDDYLRLLEGPKQIKQEVADSAFTTPLNPFLQHPLQQHSMEETFNFSSDFCTEDFGYLNELSCLSNTLTDAIFPAAGLQGFQMVAF